MNKKTPTQKEKIEMYEKFLHKINMCVMCCDNLGVQELVHNADMGHIHLELATENHPKESNRE